MTVRGVFIYLQDVQNQLKKHPLQVFKKIHNIQVKFLCCIEINKLFANMQLLKNKISYMRIFKEHNLKWQDNGVNILLVSWLSKQKH